MYFYISLIITLILILLYNSIYYKEQFSSDTEFSYGDVKIKFVENTNNPNFHYMTRNIDGSINVKDSYAWNRKNEPSLIQIEGDGRAHPVYVPNIKDNLGNFAYVSSVDRIDKNDTIPAQLQIYKACRKKGLVQDPMSLHLIGTHVDLTYDE